MYVLFFPQSFFKANLRHHANHSTNTSWRVYGFLHHHHVILTPNNRNNNASECRPFNGGFTFQALLMPHPQPHHSLFQDTGGFSCRPCRPSCDPHSRNWPRAPPSPGSPAPCLVPGASLHRSLQGPVHQILLQRQVWALRDLRLRWVQKEAEQLPG